MFDRRMDGARKQRENTKTKFPLLLFGSQTQSETSQDFLGSLFLRKQIVFGLVFNSKRHWQILNADGRKGVERDAAGDKVSKKVLKATNWK